MNASGKGNGSGQEGGIRSLNGKQCFIYSFLLVEKVMVSLP